MKKSWMAIGITVAAAGALFYPALKLYQYLAKKRSAAGNAEAGAEHHIKAFVPAFRGKHRKSHNRAENNGGANHGLA
jgi:hypothetical protein